MTSSEVARITGLSMQRIRQAAVELGVGKVATAYNWSEDDVEALKARIGKRGKHKGIREMDKTSSG